MDTEILDDQFEAPDDDLILEIREFILERHPELATRKIPLGMAYALGLPHEPPPPIDT